MLALKEFRDKAAGVPDLLNWGFLISDGVVLNKNGSLLAGFFYRGPDTASSLDAERNWIAERVNAALCRLHGGWAIWVDGARLPTEDYPAEHLSHFPDPVSRLVDNERRRAFQAEGEHFETEFAFILQYTPPLRRNTRLLDLIYDDDKDGDKSAASQILAGFEKVMMDIEDSIGSAVKLRRMRDYMVTDWRSGREVARSQLVSYLHFCLTGESVALNIPESGAYLDCVIGGKELWPGDTPKIGDQFVCCVAFQGFPELSHPGLLEMLDTLPVAFRWSSRFIFLDQPEAEKVVKAYERKWTQKIRGFAAQLFNMQTSKINEDAAKMAGQARDALNHTRSGQVGTGYYTPVVVLMDRSRDALLESARYVVREVQKLGFAAHVETVNTMEAWLGTLPGHTLPNVRRPPMHTDNLADLLPLAGVWTGSETNPCSFYPPNSPPLLYAATTGATPFRVNLHVGDLGHTLIFGPTSAGKSTLLATVALQALRYPNVSIWAFDKGKSMFAATKAVGGSHYDVGGEDSSLRFCPLSVLETESDLSWAEDWVATCFQLQHGVAVQPDERDAIHKAMLLMRDSSLRTLGHFWHLVQNKRVRDAIQPYTLDGPMGHLLDAEEDTLRVGRADHGVQWITFEVEELMAMGSVNMVPVLLYLFRRFEKSLNGDPSFLFLDEAWIMLGNPLFREKIREWLKVLRKANCAVVLATQSLSDASRSGILDVLVESCLTQIFLPNDKAALKGTAEHPGPRDFYEAMGLNDVQIEMLRTATPKQHYYLVSPEGRRLFDLGLGPIALSFAAAGSKKDIARIGELSDLYGRKWPFKWLEERDVEYENI